MNKGLRKFLALALAGTMTFGCTMTAFATEQTSNGQGNYEGGEIDLPALSVTLPTIPDGTYDYIADPNELIADTGTNNEKYTGFTFADTAQGIFFLTDSSNKSYSEKSAALTATNESYQNVDFTVKVEQLTAGSESITYSATSTFETTDTANKLYLAVTDDTNTEAITDTAPALLVTEVAGVPTNYTASCDASGVYSYSKTGSTGWESYSFYMTGALNMNATWGDGLVFPEIKVTWSYAEHQENVAPTFTASTTEVGVINYTVGSGTLAVDTITSIEMVNNGITYDAYHAHESGAWANATDLNGKITLDTAFTNFYTVAATDATIVYVNEAGETVRVNVIVKTAE